MTVLSLRRVLAGPLASAVVTAAVFIGALWVQHTRQAWPFRPASQQTPVASSPAPPPSTHDRAAVELSGTFAENLGIRLEVVGRESLTQAVRAVATIAPDESRISHVHTRVAGWVEQLDVSTTGERVTAGQPLARIFSQELLSSQTEYLAARRNTAASGITSAVIAGGRARLGVLGMTPAEIDDIEVAGTPRRLVTVVAPQSGIVVNRGVTVGTAVDPATTLLTIADLSQVWVLAEIPESAITGVRVGTTAQLDFPGSGRSPFSARVDFLYPTLTDRTRTLRVRLSVANANGQLRPGLYGSATFESVGQRVITVPRDAVVDTGVQQHVFVATGNTYEPRPVTLGVKLANRIEVRSGLQEGERIVAAGVFLLDSESRLRATGGPAGHNHGGTQPRSETPTQPASSDDHAMPPAANPHAAHRE